MEQTSFSFDASEGRDRLIGESSGEKSASSLRFLSSRASFSRLGARKKNTQAGYTSAASADQPSEKTEFLDGTQSKQSTSFEKQAPVLPCDTSCFVDPCDANKAYGAQKAANSNEAVSFVARCEQVSPFVASHNALSVRRHWQSQSVDAFEEWMKSAMGGKGFKERSQVVYRAMWKKLLKHAKPLNISPALMDAAQIQTFLGSVLARTDAPGVPSPTQQRRYLSLLSGVQSALVDMGALEQNAARELLNKKPMQEIAFLRSLPVVLCQAQEQTLKRWVARQLFPDAEPHQGVKWLHLNGASRDAKPVSTAKPVPWRTQRDCALVCLVLGSGVKLHELQSLRLRDVMVKNPDGLEPAVVRVTTNGAKERRSPLSPALEMPVFGWLGWLREQGAHDTVPIFLSSEDEQASAVDPALELDLMAALPLSGSNDLRAMSSAQIWRVVHQAFMACGFNERLARHGPTVLRNTFAVRQLSAGVPLEKVALWLGHKDPRSTEVYRSLLVEPGALRVW